MQHNQYIQVSDSQIVDPIIKLLENIRLRKSKVTIPNADEMIPSLYNDRTIRKRVLTQVIIGDTSPHFDKPIRFPRIFQNLRSPEFPTAQQKVILNRLERVPVYVVVNEAQEIIMASPRGNEYDNFFDWLYKKYYNLCVWTEDDGPISIALFFLNKEDATLYLQEVGKNDPKTTEKTNLHIQLTNLGTFYKLNRTSSPSNQAKLVADLEEIYNVVSDYIPKQLYPVHPKQKYSKTVYQGNPIYIMRPTVGKKGGKKSIVKYGVIECKKVLGFDDPDTPDKLPTVDQIMPTGRVQQFLKDSQIYERTVFFKLEDAYSAWDHFCDQNRDIRLSLVPNLEVYNLESYLLDLEDSDLNVVNDHYFAGTQDAIKDLEQKTIIIASKEEITLAKKVTQFISTSSKKVMQFSKGMLWVFTSDTLPTEENCW